MRHCSGGHPVIDLGSAGQVDQQAAKARAAGLESLLRLLAPQEPSLGISIGTGSSGRSSPAHLAARQIPGLLQKS